MAVLRAGLLVAVLAVLAVLAALAQRAAAWDHEAFFEFNVKPDGQRTVVRRELVRRRPHAHASRSSTVAKLTCHTRFDGSLTGRWSGVRVCLCGNGRHERGLGTWTSTHRGGGGQPCSRSKPAETPLLALEPPCSRPKPPCSRSNPPAHLYTAHDDYGQQRRPRGRLHR